MLAYVFYYPTFHNGPLLNFDEFSKQVTVLFKIMQFKIFSASVPYVNWVKNC